MSVLQYSIDKNKRGLLCRQAMSKYVGYSESKYRLRISLTHPRDCHLAHVQ